MPKNIENYLMEKGERCFSVRRASIYQSLFLFSLSTFREPGASVKETIMAPGHWPWLGGPSRLGWNKGWPLHDAGPFWSSGQLCVHRALQLWGG